MIIELSNKYRIEFEEVQEVMDSNMKPTLRFSNTPSAPELNSLIVTERFGENNLGTIKIFANDKSETPIAVYKGYKYISFFEKVFDGDKIHVTIQLTTKDPKADK